MLLLMCSMITAGIRILVQLTNHITSTANNLMQSVAFSGQNKIHVRDGSSLSIKHVGQSSFVSLFYSKSPILRNLLHVPRVTKNLPSVSCFAQDNNVFFEYHPHVCFEKDRATRTLLMIGKAKDWALLLSSFVHVVQAFITLILVPK